MTAKRETTGAAARLALRADRNEIAADGEDVAVCAVEVQDAQGRVRADHGQRRDVHGEGAGQAARRGQRRSDQPRVGHRYLQINMNQKKKTIIDQKMSPNVVWVGAVPL